MSNTPVPAAATALPSASSSRRSFLGASLAAALAGSTGAAAAPAEAPDVLDAIDRHLHARAALDAAEKTAAEARARCLALWPETPKRMRFMPGSMYERLGVLAEEVDVDGQPVWTADELAKGIKWKGYRIPSIEGLRSYLAEHPKDPNRRMFRAWLKRAEELLGRQRDALAASGYEAADDARFCASADLDGAIWALADCRPQTMAGVLAKAQAMADRAALPYELEYLTRQRLGPSVADDLVRILREVG